MNEQRRNAYENEKNFKNLDPLTPLLSFRINKVKKIENEKIAEAIFILLSYNITSELNKYVMPVTNEIIRKDRPKQNEQYTIFSISRIDGKFDNKLKNLKFCKFLSIKRTNRQHANVTVRKLYDMKEKNM